MFQVGDFRIALLSDGLVQVDAGGPFGLTPRALYQHVLIPDANNLIPMNLTCLLVQANGKNIVVDTGLGNKLTDKMRANWALDRSGGDLLSGLAEHGLRPEDIHLVIDTHLHGDHCAGNTQFTEDGKGVRATFPNAEYVVQRREYEDAMQPNERTRASYVPINYQPLVESGQMKLLDGDTEIVPGIHGVIARGHTPAMMVIRFESGGQQALFLADLAPYKIHFEKIGWMAAYDVEPLYTLETKRYWRQWALETGALLLFQHEPTYRAGRYLEENKVVPIEDDRR